MATILLHPNVEAEPVRQKRGPGRHPKTIISLSRYRSARSHRTPPCPKNSADSVGEAWQFMQTARHILSVAQTRLAIAQQREKEGPS
jgi:hypothetical protein